MDKHFYHDHNLHPLHFLYFLHPSFLRPCFLHFVNGSDSSWLATRRSWLVGVCSREEPVVNFGMSMSEIYAHSVQILHKTEGLNRTHL